MIKTPEGTLLWRAPGWGLGWDKWHGSTRRTAPAQEPLEAKRVIHGWSSGRRVNKVITQYQVFPLASAGVSLFQVQPQLQLGPPIDDTSRESEAEQHVATRHAPALALRHAQLMTTTASALAARPTSACSSATLLNTSNKHRQHQQHCIARRPPPPLPWDSRQKIPCSSGKPCRPQR